MSLHLDLTDEELQLLRDEAARLSLSPENLARITIVNAIRNPRPGFRELAAEIIAKNRELYERLAK